jgi:hypothetical protein
MTIHKKKKKMIVTKKENKKKRMKNAQPTSRDKGIKEGRLDFTTPPLQISHTRTQSFNIHPQLALSKHTT